MLHFAGCSQSVKHSIHFYCIQAFSSFGPLHTISLQDHVVLLKSVRKKPETACFHFPLDQHDKKHAIFILWRPRTNYSCFLSFLCSITKNTHCNNNPKTMFLVTARLLLQRNFRIRLIKKRENRKSKKSILCSFFQGKRLILGILSMPNGNKKVYGNCYTMSANNTNTNTDL